MAEESSEIIPSGNTEENQDNPIEEFDTDAIIPEEVKDLYNTLPEAQKKAVKAILVGIEVKRTSLWRGPLPPPNILGEYNNALPNGAERIFALTEKQADHRMQMEKTLIEGDQNQSKAGQILGFIIALAFLIVSFVLILKGQAVAGTIIGSVDLVALVSVFVLGKKFQNLGNSEKDDK